jgi:hypothetical protein
VTVRAVPNIDGWLLGFGGWLGARRPTREESCLAVAVLQAELEVRAREWEALARLLAHTERGRLVFPDSPAERAALFEDAYTLGWHVPALGVGT